MIRIWRTAQDNQWKLAVKSDMLFFIALYLIERKTVKQSIDFSKLGENHEDDEDEDPEKKKVREFIHIVLSSRKVSFLPDRI